MAMASAIKVADVLIEAVAEIVTSFLFTMRDAINTGVARINNASISAVPAPVGTG